MSEVPSWEGSTPVAAQSTDRGQAVASEGVLPSIESSTPLDEKYGGTGQQILAGLEGVAQGVAGPLAPAAEMATGLATAQDIRGRAAANPVTHGLTEAAGFGGSLLVPGLGEASLAGQVGNIGEHAAQYAVPETVSLISKIAQSGVKTGAEMAALQTSDEISKAITQDPNQSIGTAAINVGLSGILGGAGGAVIGSVSPLWKASMEKIGVPKIIDDAKAQYSFRHSVPNGDVPAAITNELSTRLDEVEKMSANISQLKGEAISRAIPEMNSHIETQANGVIEKLESQIEKMRQDPGSYPKRLVDKIDGDLARFKSKIFESVEPAQPIESTSPDLSGIPNTVLKAKKPLPSRVSQMGEAGAASDAANLEAANKAGFNPYEQTTTQKLSSPQQIFDAMQDLKADLQSYSKGNYGPFAVKAHDEAYDFIHSSKDLARDVRLSLEDPRVWGDAGDIQRKTNAAIKASIDAEKDAASKFTQKSAVEGGRIVDPNKVQSLVNQSLKGKAGLKGDFIGNYTKLTDDLADTINKIHTDAGLEAPVRLTPTPALDHTLGRSSAGTTLGNWLYDKGLASVAGHIGGEAIGAGLGSLVGHPVFGAIAGEKMLSPAITSIARPLLESASHSEAFKASLDYAVSVIRGEKLLNQSVQGFFKSGAEILPKHLIPDMASRDKLEKSVQYASNPNNAMNVGGNLGHYLPDHATAAASTSSNAVNYLNSLKPTQAKQTPLDKPGPIDPMKQQQYERALDVAQQPLMVLQYAKKGTLQPQDVKTLDAIFPNLKTKIVSKIYNEMINAKSDGNHIPYKQRLSLSLLTGQPLDSTMTQPNMQSIMMANAQRGAPSNQQQPHKASKQTASSMQKVNKMYATPDQSRAASRSAGSS